MVDKKFSLRFDVILSIVLSVAILIAIMTNPKITTRLTNSKSLDKSFYIQSVQYANSFWGTRFPLFKLKEVVTDSLYETRFDKPTLVILFSSSDCRECVKEELRLLQNVNDYKLDRKKFNIIAIGITASKLEILALRKITQAKYTFLFDHESNFEEIVNIHELPLIFIISPGNMILSAYSPIPGNRTHSELFFNGFLNLLKGMVQGGNSKLRSSQ